jgi:hypothetical protein
MSKPDILPICTTREIRGRVWDAEDQCWRVPCYCMNCHQQKGFATEPDPSVPGYVGYLCPECADKHGAPVGTMLSPCIERSLRANEAMKNAYGRVLSDDEQAIALDDVNSVLSRIARGL